jgi:nitrogen-specific signal transduction histidine kinase
MNQKIPDLAHEIANRLNGICTIAGCLLDNLKDTTDLPSSLKDEFTRALKIIEAKVTEASSELNKIKEELQSRGQYT